MDDGSLHTHIHRYAVFLVVLQSVGLAQACPNYKNDATAVTIMHSHLLNFLNYNIVCSFTDTSSFKPLQQSKSEEILSGKNMGRLNCLHVCVSIHGINLLVIEPGPHLGGAGGIRPPSPPPPVCQNSYFPPPPPPPPPLSKILNDALRTDI